MNLIQLLELIKGAADLAHLPRDGHIKVQQAYEELKKVLSEKPKEEKKLTPVV
jgi:hypothetical protein